MPERSAQGCAHAANDPIVEDLLILKKRIRESSHLASNFARAIASVRAHSVPLRNASEAKKLRHIGNYLATQIHSILRKRGLVEDGDCESSTALPPTVVAEVLPEQSIRDTSGGTFDRSSKVYAPAYRKQPWFVLVALQKAQAVNEGAAMSSNVLLKRMLKIGYKGDSVKLRTCLATLAGTHEVVKRSDMGYYYLTEKGRRSAELCSGSLTEAATITPTTTNITTTSSSEVVRQNLNSAYVELNESDEENASEFNAHLPAHVGTTKQRIPEDLIRQTDTWELVLVLDHREVIERRNPQILERKLQEKNVNCEVRALGIGDIQWIARRRRIGGDMQEFMLNVIVERKEVHDLSGSIIDRRFYEQKARLATVCEKCGDVNVIYLIEGSLTQITTVRTSGLHTAMGRTQMQNNFFVQQCQNVDETVTFLARVNARLLSKFPPNEKGARPATLRLLPSTPFIVNEFEKIFCLPLQTFAHFNFQFRKKTQFTVHEIYQRMLLQIPGLSAAKAVGLSRKYPNFHELDQALRKRGRDSEVEHVRYGKSQRRLGTRAREFLGHLLTSCEYTEDT